LSGGFTVQVFTFLLNEHARHSSLVSFLSSGRITGFGSNPGMILAVVVLFLLLAGVDGAGEELFFSLALV
jgi:3-dehydroquinate dehydratase